MPLLLGVVEVVPLLSSGGDSAAETLAEPDDRLAAVSDGRSLDGSGNNAIDPSLGQAGQIYPRETEARYADGLGEAIEGPDARYLSNRIFNGTNQNVFSENGVAHWSFVWGQFLDHTIGLREAGDEDSIIAFDPTDPLEDFTNDLGAIAANRTSPASGTGVESAREQANTVSSFIDAWAVYGGTDARLDWLREGTVDGGPTNNDATLLNDEGYLPSVTARGDVAAPATDLMGRLFADPTQAVVAGDVRVNENLGLTAVHTLFLREHNRIVDSLPVGRSIRPSPTSSPPSASELIRRFTASSKRRFLATRSTTSRSTSWSGRASRSRSRSASHSATRVC